MHHLQEYKQKYLLRGEGKSHEALLRIDLIA